MLARPIASEHAKTAEVVDTFRVANSWIESSIYPMRMVRSELLGKLRSSKAKGITAARVKRMSSIRRKLAGGRVTLYQMQDIAGCRAILNDADDFERVLYPYLNGLSRYRVLDDDDHVAAPKASGYRSRHLILKFEDEAHPGFDRHFVEVQLRTLLQHSWATAVEAVGLVRGEDLKGGRGSPDWLRLFQIMAGEMAEDEGAPPVPGVSQDRALRRDELNHLNSSIGAVKMLESYNQAIKYTETLKTTSADYYLIQFDTQRMSVDVAPFRSSRAGAEGYASAQLDPRFNSVLVEVDRVADLREAYPNYFLDVGAFTRRLRRALHKEAAGKHFDADWFKDWIERVRKPD